MRVHIHVLLHAVATKLPGGTPLRVFFCCYKGHNHPPFRPMRSFHPLHPAAATLRLGSAGPEPDPLQYQSGFLSQYQRVKNKSCCFCPISFRTWSFEQFRLFYPDLSHPNYDSPMSPSRSPSHLAVSEAIWIHFAVICCHFFGNGTA